MPKSATRSCCGVRDFPSRSSPSMRAPSRMNCSAAYTSGCASWNMAKARLLYQCNECGGTAPKWAGQCPDCNAWNTLIEVIAEGPSSKSSRFREHLPVSAEVCSLNAVAATGFERIVTGMMELDRTIGGGLVHGSVVLLGGDPGIGKSTLLIQVIEAIARATGINTLYVSGEESAQQISLRGKRLGLALDQVRLLTENNLERILSITAREKPGVLVID